MKKYIALTMLAFIIITCSVIEGLVVNLSPLFVQLNGLLILVSVGVFSVFWILSVNTENSYRT